MYSSEFNRITSYLSSRNMTIDDAIARMQAKLAEAAEFGVRKDISIHDKMANNWAIGMYRSYLKEFETYRAIKEHEPGAPILWWD